MLTLLSNITRRFLSDGHERTLKIKVNILYTFLIKGLNVLIGFLLVPLTIHYVNPVQNGIWLTIAAIVMWINTFDIGLGNGLRNKLAHALAVDDTDQLAAYTSTTYFLLTIIASSIFALFFVGGSFINWNNLLNLNRAINYSVWPVILLALGLLCLQFILQPINSILNACQQPFISSLILLAGQFLTLVLVCVFSIFTKGNLFVLVAIVAGSPVFVLVVASIFMFKHYSKLKLFVPKLKHIKLETAGDLINLSGAFFLIQIGALILYETDNIIITRVLGPLDVTTFNIAYKYFSLATLTFSIIITPYWSAFTDAFVKNDLAWIKHSMKRMRVLSIYFSLGTGLMLLLSKTFYKIWIGDKLFIPQGLSFAIAFYVILQNWMIVHAYMLNGVGKLRIQLALILATGVLNVPASIFLIHRYGIQGTVLANIIVMLAISVTLTYQCELIINQKATGFWNK
jgi:O-antigen/teichoic acid export membrane protein